ncbi:MAG TPA: hypothetical protein VMS40_04275, partial [Vicinamibacterales bacterium]|nr:hypothetical protein [Vicinamibacterales bacterium]
FPWTNSHHIAGDLRTGVQKLKDATPAGVLLGRPLYQSGLPSTRRLELVSAKPLRSGAVAMHYRPSR